MIRVLQIVHCMNRGGLETFIMNIYRNIDREKVQFDFLTHSSSPGDYDEEILQLGGKIYSIPPRNSGVIKNYKALKTFFGKNTFTVVHMHSSSLTYITPLILAKKTGIKTRIIHSHSTNLPKGKFHKYFHRINQLRLKNIATDFFSCSDLASKWMYGNFFDTFKVKTIKNAIDIDQFKYNNKIRNEIREKIGLEGKFVVGHVGRFAYPKNHKFIIEVFEEIIKLNKNARLLLVGGGEETEVEGIRQLIKEKELDKYVQIAGVRPDIPNFLLAMDIFLFPSLFEGLPVTLVEAQTTGLICFASDIITKEVEITGNITYLSLNDPKEKWARGILSYKGYYRQDVSESISSAGFNIKEVVQELESFYLKP